MDEHYFILPFYSNEMVKQLIFPPTESIAFVLCARIEKKLSIPDEDMTTFPRMNAATAATAVAFLLVTRTRTPSYVL